MNTNFLLNPNYVSQAGLSLYNTLEKEYNLYFIAQYTLNIHARIQYTMDRSVLVFL
jgi:hypothetical protein